jgi:hypothetical protein
MKRFIVCSLAILIIAVGSAAKMRARYFYSPNHDPEGSTTGSPDAYRIASWQKIIPGIWEGYDDNTGFDNVSTPGDFGTAPWVSAEYWVDSLFEPQSASIRKNAPLVEGWATESDLRDPSYQLSGDGYCVIAVGGLKIETAGTHEFQIDANDGFLMFLDMNGDGDIDLTSGENTMAEEMVNLCSGECGNKGQLRCNDTGPWGIDCIKSEGTFAVDIQKTGLVKMAIWYWDWGEVGHAEISWKKPGGSMQPISGTNGDLGKPGGGPPKVSITQVTVGGVAQDKANWGNLDVAECAEVTFTAEATGMQEQTPVYLWDFYGNGSAVVESADPTITYRYAYDPGVFLIQPSVRVKRGSTISNPSSETDVVFIWLSDDPSATVCPGNPATPVTQGTAGPPSTKMKLSGHRITVPGTGRNVVRLYDATGRLAVAMEPRAGILDLTKIGLTGGFYVVSLVRNGQTLERGSVLIGGR